MGGNDKSINLSLLAFPFDKYTIDNFFCPGWTWNICVVFFLQKQFKSEILCTVLLLDRTSPPRREQF